MGESPRRLRLFAAAAVSSKAVKPTGGRSGFDGDVQQHCEFQHELVGTAVLIKQWPRRTGGVGNQNALVSRG